MATIIIQVQCPVLLWVVIWLQFELVCDDPSNTVLMMPVSHACVGGEGRTSGMASEVNMDNGICKRWTTKSPRSTKMQDNKQ